MKSLKKAFARSLGALLLMAAGIAAQAAENVEMYRNAGCGCCEKWAEHLRRNGLQVRIRDVDDVASVSAGFGMPAQLASCHVARVGDYVIQGHIPAADVQRLLRERPKALGLAVPSMPGAAPGMDIQGAGSYDTLLVGADGRRTVFGHH